MERLTYRAEQSRKAYCLHSECRRFCRDCEHFEKIRENLADYEEFAEIFEKHFSREALELLRDKEEFSKWLERVRWHTRKCDELGRELQAFKDKREQGLQIELPCKVGDTVWEADEDSAFYLTECVVDRFGFDRTGMIYCIYESKDGTYTAKAYLDEFGKSIITTNEEVQQRLAKMHSEAEEALAKMGGK